MNIPTTLLSSLAALASGSSDSPVEVTWSRDVARLVQAKCEACHRPGEAGPFALQSFEDARAKAKMIAAVVEEGRMPPWNADERFDGVFANERRLSADEKAKLLAWIEQGTPRGNPAEDPAAKVWPTGWRIGEPDVVIQMERMLTDDGEEPLPAEGFRVPEEGVVEYQYFTAKTSFPEDRWVKSLEVRAGAADVVHHVLIVCGDAGGALPSLNGPSEGFLAAAVPGETSFTYPDGYAKRLPAGATLLFQLHYTPNGKSRFDRSSLALVFADETPLFEVETASVWNEALEIPPGAENFEVRAKLTIIEETGLLSLLPHMHTRGKDFRYVLHRPDGTSEDLLYSHYDFNWQESYVLRDPLLLSPGTTIEIIGHFDNSEKNPNNPDPSATVRWGDQTFEEMFIGYFDTVKPLE